MDNLAVLANELSTDPLVRGYAGMDDQAAADDLNTVYRPAPDRDELSSAEVYDAIVGSEYAALTDPQKDRVRVILGLGDGVKVGPGSQARAELTAIFGAGTQTRANLLAIVTGLEQSRAAELGLPLIHEGHVQMARAL